MSSNLAFHDCHSLLSSGRSPCKFYKRPLAHYEKPGFWNHLGGPVLPFPACSIPCRGSIFSPLGLVAGAI